MSRAAVTQGVFYVTTGLWPVLHLPSFEAIAGKKRDRWLVRTMGALIAAIGSSLLVGATERRTRGARDRTLPTLGVASAMVLAAADVYFVATRQIPRIYLADAAAEGAVIGLWIANR